MRKSNISTLFLIAFFAVGALEIIALLGTFDLMHHFAKPLLMPLLGLYYFAESKQGKFKPNNLLLVSLVFSWLGDVFLMYQVHNELYFMLGLGSFLVAHILYILCYLKLSDQSEVDKDKRPRLARYDFFLLLIWFALISVLLPVLDEMKIPVILYSMTITGMALAALHRYQKTTRTSFWMVMLGALIFMLSDSVIAINMFLEPITYAGILIMVTYIAGQVFIVKGLLAHQKHQRSSSI
jgi:uncharacterized membrane protein YhhN